MKREGTILYRNNGDIMCALSHLLAENKNHDCLTNVTDVLNNLLHEQTKGFLKRYKGHPELRCPWITLLHQSIQYYRNFYLS